MRSGPALPFFPLPLVDIADRIHSLLNTLLKPFRCPPDRSFDVLLIARQTFSRRAPDALPTGSSAGIEGSDGDNNAKVTHSTRLSKFRDKFYRQNIDNRRPGDAAPGKEGLLPARRLAKTAFRRHETGKTAPQHPEFRRSRSSGGPQRDIPGPQHTGTARHKGLGAPEPRGTGTARHKGHEVPEPQDTKVSRLRNREAQGARSTGGIPKTHPLRTPPAVSGPSPRSRRSGTCRRPRGGRAGRHPRSPRCSAGSGTPAR